MKKSPGVESISLRKTERDVKGTDIYLNDGMLV